MLSFVGTEVREYKVYIQMLELPKEYAGVQLFYLKKNQETKEWLLKSYNTLPINLFQLAEIIQCIFAITELKEISKIVVDKNITRLSENYCFAKTEENKVEDYTKYILESYQVTFPETRD